MGALLRQEGLYSSHLPHLEAAAQVRRSDGQISWPAVVVVSPPLKAFKCESELIKVTSGRWTVQFDTQSGAAWAVRTAAPSFRSRRRSVFTLQSVVLSDPSSESGC